MANQAEGPTQIAVLHIPHSSWDVPEAERHSIRRDDDGPQQRAVADDGRLTPALGWQL